ncbi:hypothetical protein Tco_0686532 [Tanacetum coccineum]
MEIRKQWMTHGIDADMEYDPSNDDFVDWIASKFSNHSNMDWYTKNALWMYWTRGDDEEVLTDKEISDLEETHVNEDDEVAEIFRIKTNIFDFLTDIINYNGNPSYQERRQTMEESLSKFMAEYAKRHEENSNLIKENYRASTNAANRNQGAMIKA